MKYITVGDFTIFVDHINYIEKRAGYYVVHVTSGNSINLSADLHTKLLEGLK